MGKLGGGGALGLQFSAKLRCGSKKTPSDL